MTLTEKQIAAELRRDAYKSITTEHRQRDSRLSILEAQALQLGWKPPEVPSCREIPTFPFVFAWSEEQEFEVRPCRWAEHRRAVWQPHRPNVGRPAFTDIEALRSAFHLVRLRKAVMQDLCMMCGQPVDTTDVMWTNIVSNPQMSDDGWAGLGMPLLHLECIRHALNGCPFLRAGFGGFAPYRGRIRKTLTTLSPTRISARFGINAHPGAHVVLDVIYQVPAEAMINLQELAAMGCPDGLHYSGEDQSIG